jgi:hypothetical protein
MVDAMISRILPKLALAVLALMVVAPSAWADHWHGGSRVFLGFNFYAPAYPAYPAYYPYSYYPPPPVAYAPPPAAYQTAPQVSLGADVGQGCREYSAPVTVGGQTVQSYGIACPRGDGTWKIVN